jgi:Myb-like DNA-binding domain
MVEGGERLPQTQPQSSQNKPQIQMQMQVHHQHQMQMQIQMQQMQMQVQQVHQVQQQQQQEEVQNRVKGSWSPEEDAMLTRLVERHGARNWSIISEGIPGRSGKSCRLRWCNQLSPAVHHRPFTPAEDAAIVAAHAKYLHFFKFSTFSFLFFEYIFLLASSINNDWIFFTIFFSFFEKNVLC